MPDFDDAQQEAILFPWVDTDEMSDHEMTADDEQLQERMDRSIEEGEDSKEEDDEEPDHGGS